MGLTRLEKEQGHDGLIEDNGETGPRGGELLANIRRLTRIVLDRLEQGSGDGTLDQSQTRMLGSIALRSLRLWHEALGRGNPGQQAVRKATGAQADQAGKLEDSEERGERP